MNTFIALIAILHAPPLPIHHSGAFYQRPVVNWYADVYLLPRWFATNLTYTESSFRPRLETSIWVGTPRHRHRIILSHGLMQTNPRYDDQFAKAVGVDPVAFAAGGWRDPGLSARVGLGRLGYLVNRYGKWGAAICYNGGEAWYRALQHGVRPLAETQTYLRRIFG